MFFDHETMCLICGQPMECFSIHHDDVNYYCPNCIERQKMSSFDRITKAREERERSKGKCLIRLKHVAPAMEHAAEGEVAFYMEGVEMDHCKVTDVIRKETDLTESQVDEVIELIGQLSIVNALRARLVK